MLAAAGCTGTLRRAPVQEAPPTPAWEDVYRILARRHAAFASFQGQGSLVYESEQESIRTAQMIVVKAPDKVRIDFRSPFTLTYTVTSDGRELAAYDRGEKVLYRGAPTVEHLARYARVPVPLIALTALLRGLPPLPDESAGGTIQAVEDGWLWTGKLDATSQITVVLDPNTTNVRQVRMMTADGILDVTFDRYEEVGGERAAHRIRAQLPGGARVEIRYGTIWLDRKHQDSAFHLHAPKGVRVIDMGA